MGAISHARSMQIALRAKVDIETVDRVFAVLAAFLEEGTQVRIRGFGTFVLVDTPGRTMKSPLVPGGEKVLPARRSVRFRVGKDLKEKWAKQREVFGG